MLKCIFRFADIEDTKYFDEHFWVLGAHTPFQLWNRYKKSVVVMLLDERYLPALLSLAAARKSFNGFQKVEIPDEIIG